MNDLVFIDDAAGLRALCARLATEKFVALDTEFERVRTYFPKLCLLQIASTDTVACIDPLALEDLTPLWEVLFEPGITKVMHAARQDFELVYHATGRLPQPLFDTQLAAAVLGFDEQIGYGALVERLLGTTLDKAHTRTDWSRRPLSPEQLRYAADDVRYVVELYRLLVSRLSEAGRLSWVLEDSASLGDPLIYEVVPEHSWRRIRGAGRLGGVNLEALKRLAAWREREAVRRDRPRQWIVRDDALLGIAGALPEGHARLARCRQVPQAVAKRHAAAVLEIVAAAKRDGPSDDRVRPRPPVGRDDERLQQLMKTVRDCALAQQINPTTLATRRELQRLLGGERRLAVLHGWRLDVIGRRLLAELEPGTADAPADGGQR